MKTLLISSLLVLAACENTQLDQEKDAGTPPVVTPDSGMMMVEQDAGVESPADATVFPDAEAPPPARTFVDRRMFGDGPVDNLVFDPNFDLSTYNWYAFSSDFMRYIPIEKHTLAWTPTHQPAVYVRKDSRTTGVFILGSAASGEGTLSASVWVGRSTADAARTATASATIVNVGLEGPETAIDLVPDPSSRIEKDGIVWVRLTGVVTDSLGVLAFLIGDESRRSFWATAPAVVPVHANTIHGEAPHFRGRTLAPAERGALEAYNTAKRMRDDPRRLESRRRAR